MQRNKLYKKDSTGKIRVWWMEIIENRYRTCSGTEGGAVVESEWTEAEGKNVGRANETSPEQQAVLEVDSKYTKKMEQEHYVTDISKVDEVRGYFSPMLAQEFKKREGQITFPLISQPKLDGIRCLNDSESGKSRKGKPFATIGHIRAVLHEFFQRFPDVVLDGELYNHDYKDDFNELSSAIKSQKPTSEDILRAQQIVQYHVYDCYLNDNITANFYERFQFLARNLPTDACIVLVPTQVCDDREKLDLLFDEYLSLGYEGQMVRVDRPYEQKRSKNLLKRKEFMDDEFTIIDIEEGKGNRSGMAGKIIYATNEEHPKEFGSGIRGGFEFYKELWDARDEIVGKRGTVRFQNYTPDGVPRFPVTVAIRDYE